MRTTLTLDPDVALLLERETHRLQQPFKQVVNEALRRGLTRADPRGKVAPYRMKPHRCDLEPGVDRLSFNRLADQLEDEAIVTRMRRRG